MRYLFYLFIIMVIMVLQTKAVLTHDIKEMLANGQIKRYCNRNLVDTLNTTGYNFFHFTMQQPTRLMRYHCPKVAVSCCTNNEVKLFVDVWKNNQYVVKFLKIKLNHLFSYLEKWKANHFEMEVREDDICDMYMIENPQKYYMDLMWYNAKAIKALDDYLTYYNDYFIGAICSVCNADINQYFKTLHLDQEPALNVLQIDISIASCSKAFKAVKNTYPLVNFLYEYIKLAKRIGCKNDDSLDIFNNYHLDEKTKIETSYNKCSKLGASAIFKDQDCKDICIISHIPVFLEDPFNSLVLLDTIHLIMSTRYGDLYIPSDIPYNVSEVIDFLNFFKLSPKPFYDNIVGTMMGRVEISGIDYTAQEGKSIRIVAVLIYMKLLWVLMFN